MRARVSAADDRLMTVNTAGVRGGEGRPVTGYAYLDAVLDQAGSVLAMAHRGGAGHPDLVGLENTLHAFQHAVALGYHYLETDVHATRDGILVAFHDEALDRVADRPGVITELGSEEVARAIIGEGHAVPTMAALLEEFPDCRFNIDIKSVTAIEPLARLIEQTGSHDRVCVGSFSSRRISEFRRRTGFRVATAAAPAEVAAFMTLPLPRLIRLVTRARVAALQVPHHRGRLAVVTPTLVRRAHAVGAQVHVWTVDEPEEIGQLVDMGVDGLITDRTDVLKDVLITRGLWRDHA